jgi:hypothetical protein
VVNPDFQLCHQESSNQLFRGDEVTPAIGSRTLQSQNWIDTSLFSGCRGGIPLRITRIAEYRATSPTAQNLDTGTIQIIRTSDVLITGSGSQWQQPVQVSGHGSSVDTLKLRQLPLRLFSITGNSHLEIDFRSLFRTQHFIQITASQFTSR